MEIPGNSLAGHSPLQRKGPLVAKGPVVSDGYRPSLPSPEIYRCDPSLKNSGQKTAHSGLSRAMGGLLLAVSAASVMAMAPQVACAQEATSTLTKEQLKAQGLNLIAKSRTTTGQSVPLQEGLAKLKPEVRQKVLQLPQDLQQSFVDLELEAAKWMVDRVQETTWVAFLPVSNKDALISGKALGFDVFNRAQAGLKKQVAQGTIPKEAEAKLAQLLQKLQGLTPEMRSTLVEALEAHVR